MPRVRSAREILLRKVTRAIRAGVPRREICKRFNVSSRLVTEQVAMVKKGRKKYDKRLAIRLVKTRKFTDEQVAGQVGCTVHHAGFFRRKFTGLPPIDKTWTLDRLRRLQQMRADRVPYSVIARELGVSVTACESAAQDRGYTENRYDIEDRVQRYRTYVIEKLALQPRYPRILIAEELQTSVFNVYRIIRLLNQEKTNAEPTVSNVRHHLQPRQRAVSSV